PLFRSRRPPEWNAADDWWWRGCCWRRRRRGRRRAARGRRRVSSPADTRQALPVDPPHGGARKIVELDLIGLTCLGRPQEEATVAAVVGLHFHVDFEILEFL